ncbi:hypothetical protein [Streptomyces sp. NPDC093707]|uniref:hypothetical protein n=1 Tax=Streptomyces sp. NPDC093707 TaxID=3154984 RepID=UPI00344D6DA9
MTTITTPRATRPGLRASCAGLVLTVAATLAPLVDVATADSLTAHVQAAYPRWSAALVAADRNAIVTYLAVVGALGLLAWSWAILGIARRKHWSRGLVTTLFALGLTTAAFDLTFSEGAYAQVIPRPYGLLGMLPVAAGLAAVVLVWHRSPQPRG